MEYLDEDEVWKCPKHPSKRRRTGICHVCLRERLASLCPDCAKERPCSCIATTSSSSSSSSSFSRSSITGGGVGSVGRVANLIESEPAFRRSRSLAVPFLRSKPSFGREFGDRVDLSESNKNKNPSSLLSFFKWSKSKRYESDEVSIVSADAAKRRVISAEEERRSMMRKSRSVAVTSDSDARKSRLAPAKGKGWLFPSPMKVFRQSRFSRVVHERSPLYRG